MFTNFVTYMSLYIFRHSVQAFDKKAALKTRVYRRFKKRKVNIEVQ